MVTVWRDPDTGLRVHWERVRVSDFPAVEWLLRFENTGTVDTPVIRDVQALDMMLESPPGDDIPYRLHRTNGAPSNPTDFEPRVAGVGWGHGECMGGGGGRSSNRDLPFFKIETCTHAGD